jgi:putative copper resistance protein D
VIEPAIFIVRLLQYAGAAVLFGSSLFFVYAAPAPPRTRAVAVIAAAMLAAASLLAIGLQASLFAGSFADGFERASLDAVATTMGLGKAALVRAIASMAGLLTLLALPDRTRWIAAAACGLVAAASLAWLGHGAAAESPLHLWADVIHVLAATVWLGALAGFLLLLFGRRAPGSEAVLHRALWRFSGIGSVLVAAVVASGLVNALFLVGPDHALDLLASRYGRVLAAKLALFAAMLAFAAANRWRLTPALGREPGPKAFAALRRSILGEALVGLAVLALVAWLGTLVPPAAS